MDAPYVVVIPATSAIPAYNTTPLPSPTSWATPELKTASIDQERSSSETTIVTIYSMYEDDGGSWSLPSSVDHDNKYHQSFLRSSQQTIEDSAYFDSTYDPKHLSIHSSPMDRSSSGATHLSNTDKQRASFHSDNYPVPQPPSQRQSPALSPIPNVRPLPTPPSQSGNSSVRSSGQVIPPGPSSSQLQSRPVSLRISVVPPEPSPHISPTNLSPSIVAPFEGEDADSFHVRRTYAELDLRGVKGDGYAEGVERTRAKVGANRQSELRAMAALGDDSEKKRDLSPREIEMLASLDRYGFFTTPSHDRLILLASAPLSRTLSKMPHISTNSEATVPPLKMQPAAPSPEREISRALKWGRMLEARSRDPGGNVAVWGVKASKEAKLRERTYKGIPDCWRSAVWELMINGTTRTGKRERDRLAKEYYEAIEKPSTYDVQIDLDVPRTISGHVMFRTRYGQGQRSLFHVLHSFSLRCSTCGYCQGMGPIAATLLSYFDPPRVYASLVRLHDAYAMHSIFGPGFPGLLEAIFVQERITQYMMPGVYDAFKKHTISTTSYATKWYITLFANSVPFHTQLRLWDVFFLEGPDLFVIMAVAIVWIYRDQIMSSSANFETVLSLLSSFFVPEDDDTLLDWIDKVMNDRKTRTNMQQWRAEWKQLVASGQDGQALL